MTVSQLERLKCEKEQKLVNAPGIYNTLGRGKVAIEPESANDEGFATDPGQDFR